MSMYPTWGALGRYGLGLHRDAEIEAELRKPGGMIVMTPKEMREFITTHERPTMQLRFLNGKLQQAFEVRRTRDCYLVSDEIDWRDVPEVLENRKAGLADATKKPTP